MEFSTPSCFLVRHGDLRFGNSATQWTAALNIDSLSESGITYQGNNAACGGAIEYVNFAFIQTNGVPTGPPAPLLATNNTFTVNSATLFMNPGDNLLVTEEDTPHGIRITVKDLTTGQSGYMVASGANQFGQILYDPNGTACDAATHNIPYDFHPMYATSSEHTRVPWAAHSYNVAFSDEIGHFENCTSVDAEGGNCTSSAAADPPGVDDAFCFDAAFALSFGLIPIGGCIDSDVDFDGVPYRNAWPGTLADRSLDRVLHPQPVIFSSPVFRDGHGGLRDYSRIAFETDLPRIETNTTPACQRHIVNPADPHPGSRCVDPPVGADFYPIFTTRQSDDEGCQWQLGGPYLAGTKQNFGGTAAAEYGPLLIFAYSGPTGASLRYNNFRRVLERNPCRALDE